MPLRPVCHHGPTNTFMLTTPIGLMELVSCPKGIHSLNHMGDNDEQFMPDNSTAISIQSQLYSDNGYTYKPALRGIEWLANYFNQATNKLITPPICYSKVKEGSFTDTVWHVLPNKVLFGKTVSYGGLAKLCGNVNASRAVGMAMRTNPVMLIIPCHRVIQSSGSLGNYSSGKKNKIKAWLLQHEGFLS